MNFFFGEKKGATVKHLPLDAVRSLHKIINGQRIYKWNVDVLTQELGKGTMIDVSGFRNQVAFSFVVPLKVELMDEAFEDSGLIANEMAEEEKRTASLKKEVIDVKRKTAKLHGEMKAFKQSGDAPVSAYATMNQAITQMEIFESALSKARAQVETSIHKQADSMSEKELTQLLNDIVVPSGSVGDNVVPSGSVDDDAPKAKKQKN